MARTIPAAVQALLDEGNANEIIVALEVFWTERQDVSIQTFPPPSGATERIWYADREIVGVPEVKAKITTLGSVDAAVQILQGGQSKSVPVELDDTDGDLKAIFDAQDVHKVPVRVWFYVAGTDFATEKFPIFLGQINSPFVWSEGERKVNFTIVNRIEDVEVGFSAEEGDFEILPEELIGQTWPLCFGTTENVPALKAVPAISGLLAGGVGIKDFTLNTRLALAELTTCPQTPIGFKCSTQGLGAGYSATCNTAFEQDQNCLQSRCVEIERLKLELLEQSKYEFGQIIIFGGGKFPQGFADHQLVAASGGTAGGGGFTTKGRVTTTITLNIGGGLFTGYFNGSPSNPSEDFIIKSRRHPRFDPTTGTVLLDPVAAAIESECPSTDFVSEDSNYTDIFSGPVWTGLRDSRISWENYRNALQADFFWAGGGSTVTLETAKEIIYVANIVPSTILAVRAKRFLNGNEFLLTVPDAFFTIRQVDYIGYQVMEIVFQRPLSNESEDTGGGWSDDIFVSQESSVGPNTVDILRWIIETYTSYAIDDVSFDDVRAKVDVYRMDFPLLARPNLLSILEDIARQSRCAIWQRDDKFFIKYLPETPTPVATITEDDILQNDSNVGTLKIELTKTLDLITKQVTTWQRDYAIPEPNKLILRHNVKRYGTHADEQDFFTFAFLDIVRKSATFWLIRSANTWKRLKMTVDLAFTLLEPFDAVTLTLGDVARNELTGDPIPVLGVVERATLDSAGKQVELEVWTPVRAGELTPYNFAFPAFISENALFPDDKARDAGDAGSGTEPNFSTTAPPGHPLKPNRTGIFSGFALGCNGDGVVSLKPGECRQDHGDKKPSDINDKKPEPNVSEDKSGDVSGGTSPVSRGAGYGGSSHLQKGTDQQNKTEGDAGRGREVGESGGTGDAPGSGDNSDGFDTPIDDDFLNSLPDPDDLPDDLCRYNVTVVGFNTESGGFSGVPSREHCTPINGSNYVEVYVYDGKAAADGHCAQRGAPACSGYPPCGICISSCSIVQLGDCSEGDGDGNLIGFRSDPNGNPPSATQP